MYAYISISGRHGDESDNLIWIQNGKPWGVVGII